MLILTVHLSNVNSGLLGRGVMSAEPDYQPAPCNRPGFQENKLTYQHSLDLEGSEIGIQNFISHSCIILLVQPQAVASAYASVYTPAKHPRTSFAGTRTETFQAELEEKI